MKKKMVITKEEQKETAIYSLNDMIEVMTTAVNDKEWAEQNKQDAKQNRHDIKNYERTKQRIENDGPLTAKDEDNLLTALEIHTNDTENGKYEQIKKLKKWMEQRIKNKNL